MLPSKVLRRGSWALVMSGATRSETPPDVLIRSALADQNEVSRAWLAHAGSFLERMEATMSRISLVSAMLHTTSTSSHPSVSNVVSTEDEGVELYVCFSPRVWTIHHRCMPCPPCCLALRDRLMSCLWLLC